MILDRMHFVPKICIMLPTDCTICRKKAKFADKRQDLPTRPFSMGGVTSPL